MKKAGIWLERLLFPPAAVLIAVPAVSFSVLVYIFMAGLGESMAAYIIYCMSAYSLTVITAAVVRSWGRIKKWAASLAPVRWAMSCGAVKKFLNDMHFRGNVGIYQGMAVNFLYVVFRLVTGIIYSSVWFISMAAYHLVLGIMRAVLIYGYRRRDGRGYGYEYRFYRICAYMLLLLNIPMGGMIVLMIRTDTSVSYPEYVIYLSAMFTFYTMIISVVNMVKYRRAGSPVLSAAKVINFVSAMMSVLGLQTAMISKFSEKSDSFRAMMNGITGGVIYGIVIVTAVLMLMKGKRASGNE